MDYINNNNINIDEFLIDVSMGYQKSFSLKIIIDLNIPSILSGGPKTCKELAVLKNVNEDNLYVIMRTLSCIGIFKEDEEKDRLFENTEISNKLIKNRDDSSTKENDLLNICQLQLNQIQLFSSLHLTVENGKAMGLISNGYKDIWEYYELNKPIANIFHDAMGSYTSTQIQGILQIIDFNQFETIVDLGGSKGELLKSILKVQGNGNIKSLINFDLPDALSNQVCQDTRYKEIGDSFFNDKTLLPIGDCFTLKFIIHLFQDDLVLIILNKISKSINNGGCVYIFDHVVSKNKSTVPMYFEYQMINNYGGKERSVKEWYGLIGQSDFKIDKFQSIPNNSISSIKLIKKNK